MNRSSQIPLVLSIALSFGCFVSCSSKNGASSGSMETAATPENTVSSTRPARDEEAPSLPMDLSGLNIPPSVSLTSLDDRDDIKYVGSESCVKCHKARHESYLKSVHSRSLAKIDVDAELLDQTYTHKLSQRNYDVFKRDGKLWHRESLRERGSDADKGELVLGEFPISYVMGSGKFARGYLIEDERFLLQSPLTWYSKTQEYSMSPNYDSTHHGSFTRAISDQCLFCHAGRVTRNSENAMFYKIHELSIGCERCHGPGAEHVKHFQAIEAGSIANGTENFKDTIVHPTKLSRVHSESVCAQCHRQGESTVSVSGKQDWDFRPGEDFADTKFHYDVVTTNKPGNGFVGHFSQLLQSKCYQESAMTCINCHSPHQHAVGEALHEMQRQQCVSCHKTEGCKVQLESRIAKAENRCVQCHMPTGESEVPHSSTTNHRIAVYRPGDLEREGEQLAEPQVFALQAVPDGMSTDEAERLHALGVYQLLRMHEGEPIMRPLAAQAGKELNKIAQSGKADAEILAAMAMITYMQIKSYPSSSPELDALWQYAMTYSQRAIGADDRPTESVGDAMEIAARFFSQRGDHKTAAQIFTELVEMRRRKFDWAKLGLSFAKLGETENAEVALREAIRIHGGDHDLYEILALVLKKTNKAESDRLNVIAKRIRDVDTVVRAKPESTQ